MTSNLKIGQYPGNISLPKKDSGLDRDSIINVTQISTIDEVSLIEKIGEAPNYIMDEVAFGLSMVMGIG